MSGVRKPSPESSVPGETLTGGKEAESILQGIWTVSYTHLFGSLGYQEQEFKDGELATVEETDDSDDFADIQDDLEEIQDDDYSDDED